ncbi:MAG TPA: carboxypeptidase regulatory-like domain-containing protein [Candidatus Dormibacteraeota bacterium]|nr:carboxypeptidase regulatory-like domain-containing protein [Candidatus Dormibacteraeota bacterium]
MILCAAIFVPAALWAQYPKVARQRPGSLNGRVVSAKGTPVAGAMIMWQASDGGIPHVLHSDGQGRFYVRRLRTGLYAVRASAGRTWSVWKQNVMVPPGGAAHVTLRLAFEAPSVAVVELKGTMHTWNVPVVGALPHDPAVDPKGNIWFTLQASGHLARFNPDTHVWKLFKVPTPDSGPHGLVSDANGNIWFTENYVGKIGRLDARTGAFSEFSTHLAKDPHTPVIGPDGAVWFTAQNSNVIGRLDVDTGKVTEYGIPTQNSHPYGMVSANDGGLWFCELTGQRLGRVDPSSGVITEFTPSEPNVHPRRLVAVNGAIYFTDSGGGRLGRLTLADKKFKFWNSPSGKNSEPYGIAADSTGKIWYVESAASPNKLVRFNPAVEVFTVFAMPAPDSSVRNIARDARGRLWMPLSLPDKIMVVE